MRVKFNRRDSWTLYAVIFTLDLIFLTANFPPFIDSLPPEMTGAYSLTSFLLRQLDLSTEARVATWYSSILLLVAGSLAAAIPITVKQEGRVALLKKGAWWLIAALLLALSADEVAQIHEQLPAMINAARWQRGIAPIPDGPGEWLPLVTPIVVVTAVGLILFFVFSFLRNRRSLIISLVAVACWIGVIFAEMAERGYPSSYSAHRMRTFAEESLEVVGTTLLIVAFIEYYIAVQTVDSRAAVPA